MLNQYRGLYGYRTLAYNFFFDDLYQDWPNITKYSLLLYLEISEIPKHASDIHMGSGFSYLGIVAQSGVRLTWFVISYTKTKTVALDLKYRSRLTPYINTVYMSFSMAVLLSWKSNPQDICQ